MAETEKPELNLTDPAPEPRRPRARHKRVFKIDKEALGKYVVDTHTTTREEYQDRMDRRMARRNKLMGWLPGKDFPWPESSNFWIPVELIADLKTRGVLENALK